MANPLILMLPLCLFAPQQPDPAKGVIMKPFLEAPVPNRVLPKAPVRPRAVAPAIPGRLTMRRNNKQVYLEAKPVPSTDPDEEEPAAAPGRGFGLNINEMIVASETFDQYVFEDGRATEERRAYLHKLLVERINRIDGMWPLPVDQMNKLLLAGSGDIQRFFDRVEEGKRQFEGARQDFAAGLAALDRLEPLAEEYRSGPFGAKSMFMKAFGKILADAKLPVKPISQGS